MEPLDRTAATHSLARARGGDPTATASLMPLVYSELRAVADRFLRHERAGHTLQPTALVHEAFLRLFEDQYVESVDRAHFLGLAAVAMRRILVEHARARASTKRGGHADRITLDCKIAASPGPDVDILVLEEALVRLAALEERQARVVELRFFGGLTLEEVAEILGVSRSSVKADWTLARVWLQRELTRQ